MKQQARLLKTPGEFEADTEGRHVAMGPEDYDTDAYSYADDLDELFTSDIADLDKIH